jgi:hypothetical protein
MNVTVYARPFKGEDVNTARLRCKNITALGKGAKT